MANIYEVAKRAGVSTATVSRVLSQPDIVAPATRRQVMAAITFLGFTPLTTIAQPMRQIGEGTVRLLLEILVGDKVPESVTLPHTLVVRSSTAANRRSR